PGLQGVLRRLQGTGPGRLGRAVGGAHGHRRGAHRHPVPLRRAQGELLMMIERRPFTTALSHVVLVPGVFSIGFPLYITFVASTHTAQDIVQVPMPLLPGPHMIENYTHAIQGTSGSAASTAPVGRMMTVSLITALVIAIGKIAISLLSAF